MRMNRLNGRLSSKHYPQLKIKKEYERIRKQLDEKMGIGKKKKPSALLTSILILSKKKLQENR